MKNRNICQVALVFVAALLVTIICCYMTRLVGIISGDRFGSPHRDTEWFIVPPQSYLHVQDKEKDAVAQWLQGKPYPKSFLESLQKSPYTYEEWLDMGKVYDHLEETLLAFYIDEHLPLCKDDILEVLFELGSNKSVPVMLESYKDHSLTNEQKNNVLAIIGKYGDAKSIKPLCQFIDSMTITPGSSHSERILKLNLVATLGNFSPAKAREYLYQMQEDPNFQLDQKSLKHLLRLLTQQIEEAEKVLDTGNNWVN